MPGAGSFSLAELCFILLGGVSFKLRGSDNYKYLLGVQ